MKRETVCMIVAVILFVGAVIIFISSASPKLIYAKTTDYEGSMIAVVSTVADRQVLCLIDTDKNKMCLYEVNPANEEGTLRLLAVRNYQWDFSLDVYQNVGLLPSNIKTNVPGGNN